MSETGNQATSILLPPSIVAVFSRDQATLESARNVAQDWRFARVKLQVQEGDVSTAAEIYKNASSPNLIIVQTDTIDDSLAGKLESLAAGCDEGTAAIVIGPVNDVNLYRKLIDMGVSDYLVRPIASPDMAEVIAKTLIERIGVTDSRLIAFLGAKGGVGASALAQAAAWGVADILREKTMLVDPSGGWSTLSVGLGFEPSTTLTEAVRAATAKDEDRLRRMIFSAGEKLSVLASGGDAMLDRALEPGQMETLIDTLMTRHPVIVADLSHASSELMKAVVVRANQLIVVSTPTLPSLRLARSLIQELRELRGGEDDGIEMIINMQGLAPANEVARGDIEKALDFKVSAAVPFLPKLFVAAESESRALTADKEGRDLVSKSLLPILQKVLAVHEQDAAQESPAKTGMFSGLLGKLRK